MESQINQLGFWHCALLISLDILIILDIYAAHTHTKTENKKMPRNEIITIIDDLELVLCKGVHNNIVATANSWDRVFIWLFGLQAFSTIITDFSVSIRSILLLFSLPASTLNTHYQWNCISLTKRAFCFTPSTQASFKKIYANCLS